MKYNVLKKTYPNGHSQYTIYHYPIIVSDENKEDIKEECPFFEFTQLQSNNENETNSYKNMLDSDRRALKKIYDYARSNEWQLFITLTYNKEKINRYDYDEILKKTRIWLNNISQRYCNSELKYLLVPELHEDGAYHFHGFFSNLPLDLLRKTGRIDCRGRTVFDIPKFTLGRTDVTFISSSERASTYITKYVTKCTHCTLKGKRHYLASKNLELPIIEKIDVDTHANILYQDLRNDSKCLWGTEKKYIVNGQELRYNIVEMDK